MKPTVYIETSVISYYAGRLSRDLVVAAHQQTTAEWWDTVLPQCSPRISSIVLSEIAHGDPDASRRRLHAVKGMPSLGITDGVIALSRRYMDRAVIPKSAEADSLHLALAAWHGLDYLVTWNCRHIASARVRAIIEQINRGQRIATPTICTPEELMEV